jgi:hypothetical protein
MLDMYSAPLLTGAELMAAPGDIYQCLLGELSAEIQARVDVRLAQGFSGHEALAYAAPLIRAAQRAKVLRDCAHWEAAWARSRPC